MIFDHLIALYFLEIAVMDAVLMTLVDQVPLLVTPALDERVRFHWKYRDQKPM
jgi:hypothetical protein